MARSSRPRPPARASVRAPDTLNPPVLRPPPEISSGERDEDEIELLEGATIPPPLNPLDEVERALSVLDGRHHDTVRVQRETQLAIAQKRAAAEEAERRARVSQRRSRVLRVFLIVLVLVVVGWGGAFVTVRYRRAVMVDAALAKVTAPYLAAGWKSFRRPLWQPRDRVEVTLGASTCVVALAARASSPAVGGARVTLSIERPGGSVAGDSATAYCTCGEERVLLHTDGDPSAGVAFLYQDARAIGGNPALPFLSPRPAVLPLARDCNDGALDAWLATGHGISLPSEADLPFVTRLPLASRAAQLPRPSTALKLVASAPPGIPFAVVEGAPDTCFLATTSAPFDELALRRPFGETPLRAMAAATRSARALGWCSRVREAVTVHRTGAGPILVYAAPSRAVAGTSGLRELAASADLGDLPIWVNASELGWDASAPLVADGVAPADIAVPSDARPVIHARVLALTLGEGRASADPDELDRYACAPSLDLSPRNAVCVQSTPLGWRAAVGPPVGIAESPLPFWMDVMTDVEDRRGLVLELQLLALARRLDAEGYEPTARSGVVEEASGIEVVGRVGDDRAVAVGLLSQAPWVLPYTDGAAWTLEGAPRVIALHDGEHLHLTSRPWSGVPFEARRTVVFRHRGP